MKGVLFATYCICISCSVNFSSTTKTEHHWGWLPSLHHGYQTDSGLVKLNTKRSGGKRKEKRHFHSALKDIFTVAEQNSRHNVRGMGPRCRSTSLRLPSLIWLLQTKHVCWVGGDGPVDKRRFDLFSSLHGAARQSLDVSSVHRRSPLFSALAGLSG